MQKIENFLLGLLYNEKAEFRWLGRAVRRQTGKTREEKKPKADKLTREELAPIIEVLAWHMRGYRDRKSFFAGLPQRKIKPSQWEGPKSLGRPKEDGPSCRDLFLMDVHQVLRDPGPPRGSDRLRISKPILPANCYGFIHPMPLLKNILRRVSPKESFPANFPLVKKRRTEEFHQKGLHATAQRFLDDTRRNRRLNPKGKFARPSPVKPADTPNRAVSKPEENDPFKHYSLRNSSPPRVARVRAS